MSKGSRKKVLFLVAWPLRGRGLLRKRTFLKLILAQKKSRGGGEGGGKVLVAGSLKKNSFAGKTKV